MARPEILAMAKLSPLFMQSLNEHFVVHERLHETDPVAFAAAAQRIRASAALIEQLPALEIISVMGVAVRPAQRGAAPHIGSATGQTRLAMADLAFGNLQAHFEGKPLLSPVRECR